MFPEYLIHKHVHSSSKNKIMQQNQENGPIIHLKNPISSPTSPTFGDF